MKFVIYIFPGLILLFICSLVIYLICLSINYVFRFDRTRNDLTQRYTKAIEQLGSDNLIIRLGGI